MIVSDLKFCLAVLKHHFCQFEFTINVVASSFRFKFKYLNVMGLLRFLNIYLFLWLETTEKMKWFFRDAKWCFDASWGSKELNVVVSFCSARDGGRSVDAMHRLDPLYHVLCMVCLVGPETVYPAHLALNVFFLAVPETVPGNTRHRPNGGPIVHHWVDVWCLLGCLWHCEKNTLRARWSVHVVDRFVPLYLV